MRSAFSLFDMNVNDLIFFLFLLVAHDTLLQFGVKKDNT